MKKFNWTLLSLANIIQKLSGNYVNSRRKTSHGMGNVVLGLPDGTRNVLTNDLDKAEAFSMNFKKMYTKEPLFSINLNEVVVQTSVMPDIVFSEDVVKKYLFQLNVSKSAGPDNLHPRLLKEYYGVICTYLKNLFDFSHQFGVIPDDWKTSFVPVLHKKGRKIY